MPAYRVRTIFTGVAGAPYMSNFYFDAATVGSAQDAADLTTTFWNAVDALMTTACLHSLDTDVALFSTPDTIAGWESVLPQSASGASSAEAMPPSNQILCRWSTGVVYQNRLVRGRTFIPALTEESNLSGAVNPAAVTLVNTAVGNLAGTGLVVASKVANTFELVNSGSVWNQFAVLRSRRD